MLNLILYPLAAFGFICLALAAETAREVWVWRRRLGG